MVDRREQIAARLLAIAKAVPGVNQVVRNQVDVAARLGPWVVLWDGDETVTVQKPGNDIRSVGASVIIELSPELRILAEASAPDVGTTLNAIRAALIAAIVADARLALVGTAGSLAAIIGNNGDLSYEGCTTSFERGQRVEGMLAVQFTIHYPLIQAELVP